MSVPGGRPIRRWRKTVRNILLLFVLILVMTAVWMFRSQPHDLLKSATRLINLSPNIDERYLYRGRISRTEILLLHWKNRDPIEAVAIDVFTGKRRLLPRLTSFVNQHVNGYFFSVFVSPDGHRLLWANHTQAGITDLEVSFDIPIDLKSLQMDRMMGYGSYINASWSQDSLSWLLTRFVKGVDTPGHAYSVLVGDKSHGKMVALQSDIYSTWGMLSVAGMGKNQTIYGTSYPSTHIIQGNIITGASTDLKLEMLPDGADQVTVRPTVGNRLLWQYRTSKGLFTDPILRYFSRWLPGDDGKIVEFVASDPDGTNGNVIGQISPAPEGAVSSEVEWAPYYVSGDGHELDFEWDGWLYTTSMP